jgi:outer membrane receptor protein involved in Fe transport
MKFPNFSMTGCRLWRIGMLVAVVISLMPSPSLSQTVYGSIYGTALDGSGAVVANAAVLVTSQQKGVSFAGKTGSEGEYRVDHLVADTYDVTITAAGFKSFTLKGVEVHAGDSPRVDATMEIGSTSESVTVAASSEALLKTETQDVSLTITQDTVANIPLQARAANNLILLNPGASTYFGQWGVIPEIGVGGAWYNVDGQPQGSEDFTLDGTDNEDLMLGTIVINPAPDSMSSVKVITNNYSADIGKSNSAVLPMETKSGSNAFHGLISDFRTSSANLAINPFSAIQSNTRHIAPALNNQMEGNIGGPIFKNRMFFFFDYYGQRGRLGGSTTTTVPTAHLRNTCLGTEATFTGVAGCDFSEYALPVSSGGFGTNGIVYQTDHATPYSGNVIPTAQLSQPVLNLLKLVPGPNVAVGPSTLTGNNFSVNATGIANTGQYTARVDNQLTSTTHVFGRYTYFRDHVEGGSAFGNSGAQGPNVVSVGGISNGHNQSWALGLDDAVKPNLLTDVRLGYFRYRVQSVKFDQDKNTATDLGMPGLNTASLALTGGSPGWQISGGPTMNFGTGLAVNTCNCPLQELEEQFQVVNNWTKIAGSHTFRFGVDIRYGRQFRADSGSNRTGNLSFTAGPTSNGGTSGGLGIATFLTGQVSSFVRTAVVSGDNAKEFQKRDFFYAQDTWRVTQKLSMNLGLRWDLIFPERVNGPSHGSALDLNSGNLVVAGVGSNSLNMNYGTTWGNWAPRVGFSYQVNSKTVLRGGYGRSFAMGSFGTTSGVDFTESLPIFATQSIPSTSAVAPVFNLAAGPPTFIFPTVPTNGMLPLPNGITVTTRPNPLRFSTVDAWNISFQRAITSTMTMTVAYAGNKGTHVWSGIFSTNNVNQAFAVLPATLSVTGIPMIYDPQATKANIATAGNPFSAQYPDIDAKGHTAVTKYLLPYYAKYGWTQGINYNCNCSDNHFNALQISLAKQFSKGLSLNANYAWQKAMDYDSNYFAVNRKAVYGPEQFSKRQVFNLFGFYELPLGRKGLFLKDVPRWADYLIGGYQIAPLVSIQSGLPFSMTFSGCSNNGINVPVGSPCYPDQTGPFMTGLGKFNPVSHTRSYFTHASSLLTSANAYGPFSVPALGSVGNAGRNTFWGPGQWNADISVSKSVPIREDFRAQFRVDAFNAFNHINPGNPGTGVDAASGGVISSINTNLSPRQLEFAAKILF